MSLETAIDSLEAPDSTDRLRPVRIWLYVLALAVLLMVAVGGLTRLTDSGLSITSWKPISGMIPPLSADDWQAEYHAYRQIPEFQLQNHWMDVEDFKSIFWWEWGHRFLGRVIGILFAVPFVVFLVQKRLPKSLAPALAALFVLGGFQGFLGWWMVSSGLSERVDVSQYRLAAHLGAAALLFSALVYVVRMITPQAGLKTAGRIWYWAIWLLAALVFSQILKGAFVAGLDAGYGYSTWPLMEGRWIPEGLWAHEPVWLNLFENTLTVQFAHRVLAYVIALYALVVLWAGWRGNRFEAQHKWLLVIAALLALQILLGIATLLLIVPIPLAIAHQAVAFILLGCCVAYLADMRQVVI